MSEPEKLINPTWKIEYKPDIQEVCVSLWCNNADSIPVRYITIPLNLKDYNMRLLAAAPEMYRLLKVLSSIDEPVNEERFDDLLLAVDEARKVLSRIDGEEAEE